MVSHKIKEEIKRTRELVHQFYNIDKDNYRFIFTSSGSESNNMAIQGLMKVYKDLAIITTTIEHSSILKLVDDYDNTHYLSIDKDGYVNLNQLEDLLKYLMKKNSVVLVSVQYVNGEIGIIQNIKKISEICKKYNVFLHVDATQVKNPKQYLMNDDIDMITVSFHKITNIGGLAGLFIKKEVTIKPLIYGEQEYGLRGGTENTKAILSLKEYLCHLEKHDTEHDKTTGFTKLKETRSCIITTLFENNCKPLLFPSQSPYIIGFFLPKNVSSESFLINMEAFDIYLSNGSACNNLNKKQSQTLKSMGYTNEEINRFVRISLNQPLTTKELNWFKKSLKLSLFLLTL